MASCTVENWTLESLSSALQDMNKDNKRIAVPMFQRGKRWSSQQQRTFIDSLIKGFPVGTMLFYETFEDGVQTYILVDGLQRHRPPDPAGRTGSPRGVQRPDCAGGGLQRPFPEPEPRFAG